MAFSDRRLKTGVAGYADGGEVDEDLFGRLLKQESGARQFDKRGDVVVSPKGAVGMAQVMPGTMPEAARYAVIDHARRIILAKSISGALGAGIAVNELLGTHQKLLLNFTGGAGFTGIAVALMGRNHPAGVLAAALLFGALAQGGAELSFEMPEVPRDLVLVVQGLVILFTGALGGLLRAPLARLLAGAR
jgi:simple sugar transport system permease protein